MLNGMTGRESKNGIRMLLYIAHPCTLRTTGTATPVLPHTCASVVV